MLLVKTRLGQSARHGIGLFAEEFIRKGQHIWVYHKGFDQAYSEDEIATLPSPAREQIFHYAYVSATLGKWVMCMDDARFMNHADDANTFSLVEPNARTGITVAKSEIYRGQEITCDYIEFDSDARRKLELDQA